MIAASFTVQFTLQGPLLTQSTTQGRFGVDAVMARSGGHFYLPGTLVKGLVGEAWQELSCVDSAFEEARKGWLGESSAKWSDEESRARDVPKRGKLFFEDLIDYTTPVDDTPTRFRIEIDDARGSVEHGHYLVIEAPYPSGKHVVFEGTLWVLCDSREQAEDVRKLVRTALRWVVAVGAERSVGFGRVVDCCCGPLDCAEWHTPVCPSPYAAFDLALRFTHPVCFARRRVADNLFDSEIWIAGGALKGALAALLDLDRDRWHDLRAHLHAVRFTHAYPTPTTGAAGRPIYPPESLVTVDGHEFHDAIFVRQGLLLDDKPPAFKVDWKGDAESGILKRFGWADPPGELRVRTAIDSASRRAADDQLFAYRMIVPDGVTWHASVSLAGVDATARSTVAAELQQLLRHGLFALGKTKARALVTTTGSSLPPATLQKDLVVITLQSAALLCDPSRHLLQGDQHGSTDRDAMWAEYADVWKSLSGGSLALENYFHRQSLAGGGYLRHRFQHSKPYRPYLLTEAGSVFLFRINDADRAAACLTRWLQRGIELSPAVRRFYLLDKVPEDILWTSCPYVPENGFGEIAVDVHLTPRQDVQIWKVEEALHA